MITTSFFSYKGGSCRSTTTMNTSYFIATELNATAEKPIILVDMDVDSAGLTILFESHYIADKLTVQELMKMPDNGVNEILDPNYRGNISGHPFFSQLIPVGKRLGLQDNRAALLLAADISHNSLFTVDERTSNIIGRVRNICEKYECAALIFDTPTGAQVNATISLGNSDIIVCCMRPTFQFRAGTAKFLCESFSNGLEYNYILCPTAVSKQQVELPGGVIMPDGLRDLYVEDVIFPIEKINYRDHIDERMILNNDGILGIPEVALFKWKEACLSNIDRISEDEEEAFKCYNYLARLIIEDVIG